MRIPKIPSALVGFVTGLLLGLLPSLILGFIVVDQSSVMESAVEIVSTDSRQGDRSLKWMFQVGAGKKYIWQRATPALALLHLECGYDQTGRIQSIDLRRFKGIRFYASSSSEGLAVTEFNLFVGPEMVQYRYAQPPVRISTLWREYYIDFDGLQLAPWANRETEPPNRVDLCCVSAMGFDMKTISSPSSGSILLDYVRLVGWDGSEVVLDDFERPDPFFVPIAFQGAKLRWKTAAQTFP